MVYYWKTEDPEERFHRHYLCHDVPDDVNENAEVIGWEYSEDLTQIPPARQECPNCLALDEKCLDLFEKEEKKKPGVTFFLHLETSTHHTAYECYHVPITIKNTDDWEIPLKTQPAVVGCKECSRVEKKREHLRESRR